MSRRGPSNSPPARPAGPGIFGQFQRSSQLPRSRPHHGSGDSRRPGRPRRIGGFPTPEEAAPLKVPGPAMENLEEIRANSSEMTFTRVGACIILPPVGVGASRKGSPLNDSSTWWDARHRRVEWSAGHAVTPAWRSRGSNGGRMDARSNDTHSWFGTSRFAPLAQLERNGQLSPWA